MEPVAGAGVGARLLRAAVFAAVCAVLSALGHTMGGCAGVPGWAVAAGFLAVFFVAAPLAGRSRSMPGTVLALAAGQLGLHVVFGLAQQRAVLSGAGAGTGGGGDAIVRTASALVCGGGSGLSHAQALGVLTRAGIKPADVLAADAPPLHGMAGMPGMHGMAGMPDMLGLPGVTSASGLEALMPSLPMVVGHLLAALATGWLLRRSDLALARVVQLSATRAQALGEVRETLTDAARLRALRDALTLVRHLLAGLPGALEAVPCRPDGHDVPATPPAVTLHHTVIRRGPPTALALAA